MSNNNMTKKNTIALKSIHIYTLLKGLIVGGTMLVPGVSGGSMAMILGIYDKLISSVSSFSKNLKHNLLFLSFFTLGGTIGIILFANPILSIIETHPMPTLYFFLGAVAGGIPLIITQSKVNNFSYRVPLYISIGLLLVLALASIPTGIFVMNDKTSFTGFILLLAAGIIAAIALVLPGISVSYLLLVMGLYDTTMEAISTFNFAFLITLGVGVLLGIILTTKMLEYALSHHTTSTYLIILGFVLGSIYEIFPGIPTGIEIIICGLSSLSGYCFISYLSKLES
jgi:putative membrane protein